jgi:hypothetical protein
MASVVLLVVALAAERYALRGSLQERRNQRFGGRSASAAASRSQHSARSGIGGTAPATRSLPPGVDVGPRDRSFAGASASSSSRRRSSAVVQDDADVDGVPLAGCPRHRVARPAVPFSRPGNLICIGPSCGRGNKARRGPWSGVAAEMEAAAIAERRAISTWAALIVDAVTTRCTSPRARPQGDRAPGLLVGALEGRDWRSLGRLAGKPTGGRSLWQAWKSPRRGRLDGRLSVRRSDLGRGAAVGRPAPFPRGVLRRFTGSRFLPSRCGNAPRHRWRSSGRRPAPPGRSATARTVMA